MAETHRDQALVPGDREHGVVALGSALYKPGT